MGCIDHSDQLIAAVRLVRATDPGDITRSFDTSPAVEATASLTLPEPLLAAPRQRFRSETK